MQKKTLYIILVFIMFVSTLLTGQQQAQYSQHMLNKYLFNPAFAGLDFSLSANLMYRNQWNALPGNPSNLSLNAHVPFYKWSGAMGGIVEQQSFGVFKESSIAASYNYVLGLQYGLLSMGGRVGLTSLSLDGNAIVTPEGVYSGLINHKDPILVENVDLGIGARWDVGAYFFNKQVEGGISLHFFPKSTIALKQSKFDHTTHASLYCQYNFKVLDDFAVMQSILLKMDFQEIQTDISTIVKINGNIFGGINIRGYSSRSFDAVSVIVGTKLGENYTLSYSYDIGLSGLQNAHEGTHELLLNYNLRKMIGNGAPPKVMYNPRYL